MGLTSREGVITTLSFSVNGRTKATEGLVLPPADTIVHTRENGFSMNAEWCEGTASPLMSALCHLSLTLHFLCHSPFSFQFFFSPIFLPSLSFPHSSPRCQFSSWFSSAFLFPALLPFLSFLLLSHHVVSSIVNLYMNSSLVIILFFYYKGISYSNAFHAFSFAVWYYRDAFWIPWCGVKWHSKSLRLG